MKKKVFIVDPSRDSALAFAAAIKHEDLSPQVFEDDAGFYAAVDSEAPDLIILRAEGTKSSGYAICNRLKGTPKTAAIKTIIITLRGDDQMAVHKKSQLKADAYVTPPLGLKELRIDALALTGIEGALVDDGQVDDVEEDPFAQLDKALEEKEQSKPEAPVDLTEEEKKANAAAEAKAEAEKKASHNFSDDDIDGAFGILGDKPKEPKPEEKPAEESDEPELIEDDDFLEVPEAPKMVSPLQDMSEEDLAFVNNSFQQNVDRGAPPLPPGITRKEDLTGPDAKIYQLREALREKEQELYRLQQIWEQHDKAFAESAQHVLEKDVEVTQLRMQVDELKANLARRNEDDKRKDREFSASADRLIEEKVLLEKDLIEVVAAKEKIAHEQRRMLAARERDIEELRTKSEHDRMTLEAERNQAAANYEQQLAEMRGEIARLVAQANADAEAARAERDRLAFEQSEVLAARDRATQELEAKLLKEMDDQRATAEGLLSETRTVFEGQIAELRQKYEEQSAALNQKVEGLLGQLGDSDAKLQSTGAELAAAREKINEREATIESKGSGLQRVATELSDVKQQLATKEGELTEARQVLREKDERDLQQTSEVARLTERLTQSEASLSLARQGHEGDSAQLQGQLDAKARANESLQAELGSLRERLATLESTAQERTATLLQELDVARTANKEMALKLEQRLGQKDQIIAQKDEMLAQLSKEVGTGREEREGLVQRLSERLKEREATIAKRDDEVLFARGALSQQEKAFEARMKEQDAARAELEKQHAATAARLSEVQKQAGDKLEGQMLELEQIKQALKLANERLATAAAAPPTAPPPSVTVNTAALPPLNSAPAAALAAALGVPAPRPGFPAPPPPPAAAPAAASPEEDSLLDDVGKKLGI